MTDHTPKSDPNLNQMGPGVTQNNDQETARILAANLSGQLLEQARTVNRLALHRKGLQIMRREKVGNPRIKKLAF